MGLVAADADEKVNEFWEVTPPEDAALLHPDTARSFTPQELREGIPAVVDRGTYAEIEQLRAQLITACGALHQYMCGQHALLVMEMRVEKEEGDTEIAQLRLKGWRVGKGDWLEKQGRRRPHIGGRSALLEARGQGSAGE